MVKTNKSKAGEEQYLQKDIIFEDNRDIIIGRIPVMVKSDLCWMSRVEKGDCDFDHGGYFLIKGAEKVTNLFFHILYCSIFCLVDIDYFYKYNYCL